MREFTDRRAEYYERAADLIAADPLGFYTRAERGREIQRRIKPKDLQPFDLRPIEPAPAAKPDNVLRLPKKRTQAA